MLGGTTANDIKRMQIIYLRRLHPIALPARICSSKKFGAALRLVYDRR